MRSIHHIKVLCAVFILLFSFGVTERAQADLTVQTIIETGDTWIRAKGNTFGNDPKRVAGAEWLIHVTDYADTAKTFVKTGPLDANLKFDILVEGLQPTTKYIVHTKFPGDLSLNPAPQTITTQQSATPLTPSPQPPEKDAPGSYSLLAPLPYAGSPDGYLSVIDQNFKISDFVKISMRILIGIAGVLAVVMIIVVGVQLMTTDSFSEKSMAKERMMDIIGGLVLALCSVLLLGQINPDLLEIRFGNMKKVSVAGVDEAEWLKWANETIPESSATVSASNTSSTTGCDGSMVSIPSGLEKKPGVDDNICAGLGNKLLEVQNKTSSVKWIITATTNGEHSSLCHKKGTQKTGGCADIALRDGNNPVPADDERWGVVCKAISQTSNLDFLNEASKTPGCENIHPYKGTKYGTGPHIHVIYTGPNTGGSGGGIAGVKGLTEWTGVETIPDGDWNNTKPELKPAYEAFQAAWQNKGNPKMSLRQVYRPDAYARYIRALWEYDQLIKGKDPLKDLYGCDNFNHITQQDLNSLTPNQLAAVKQKIQIHNNNKGPACKSDHGAGIAFDIASSSIPAANKRSDWFDTAIAVGLCHHISGDLNHFALKQYLPSGVNCKTQ